MAPQKEGFRIRITEKEHEYAVNVECPLGSLDHVLNINFQDLTYYLKLRELRESLQPSYLVDKTLPNGYIRKFGKELFDILFTKEMKELFRKCLQQCVQKGKALQILLESESLIVHQMPWEIMYYEEENIFLGNSAYLAFSRSIPDATVAAMDPVKPPLKLLVFVSNPLNLPDDVYEIDIGEVERLVGTPLKRLRMQGWVTPEFSDDTRFDSIRNRMREGWNIIHFVGHGSSVKGKTYILIEDDKRNRFLLPADKVPDLFESERRPNLILFSACESAQVPLEIHSGIPFALLKKGFPGVIAMQYSILVEVADAFVNSLYENLGKIPVDKAVSEARMILYQNYGEDDISWFTPVLYVTGFGPVLEFEKGITPEPLEKEERVDFLTDLPRAEMFFGRKKYRLQIEEAFFEKKKRVVVLTGIGGIGKSSLAREFADRSKDKYKAVFAKRITADFSLKAFFEEIAEFLSANKDDSFKEVMNTDVSVRAKLEYFCRSLNADQYLLVLDGFESVMEKMKIKPEMKTLLDAFVNGDHKSNVIITSRYGLREYEIEQISVENLSFWSCLRILKEKKVELDWKEMKYVYRKMGGNPKYYQLLAPLIKMRGKEDLLKAMKEARKAIDVWLLDELISFIPDEKEVLKKVSVFRIPFGRNALELAGATNEMVETLLRLSLLSLDELYSVHSIVRDYCVDGMTREEKESAHELAIQYYMEAEKDFEKLLERHYHFLKAKRFENAAEIALGVTETLATQGYMRLAFQLNVSASWGALPEVKSRAYHNLCHIIYTFPIDLAYSPRFEIVRHAFDANVILSQPPVRTKALDRVYEKGFEFYRKIAEKKMNLNLIEEKALEEAVISTGKLTEFMLTIQEAAIRSLTLKKDVIEYDDVLFSLEILRRTYDRTLTKEHAVRLIEIHDKKEGRDSRVEDSIVRDLLFSLTAVEYESEEEGKWCEVNPLLFPLIEQWKEKIS